MTDFTYAVADLHGRSDLLNAAVASIGRHAPPGGRRTVVFLGDYVDRGPGSRQILERLMAGSPPGWRWICLKGNHEHMMVMASRGRAPLQWWAGNGGDATLASFGGKVPKASLSWADGLPLLHQDAFRIYVHAGVDEALALDQQSDETLLWVRHPERYARGYGRFHVVHGHTPFPDGPKLLQGRTNLDTLAWETGRLVVGVFRDDLSGGPIELIGGEKPVTGQAGPLAITAPIALGTDPMRLQRRRGGVAPPTTGALPSHGAHSRKPLVGADRIGAE